MSSQVPIDTNAKVTKYLANLNYSQACRNVGSSHINTAALQTLRGPGQAAQDPLQFVSTSAVSLAENARKLISITEQQKRERAKLARNGPQFDNNESWQEDLDTWRRKRKTKVSKQDCSTIGSTSKDYTKDYHSLPNYGRSHKDAKEEILTITSLSHHEDQNDSGIENRTTDSHSPSTSLDFSPRSDSKLSADRSISSKVATSYSTIESSALPDYVPPPPPPSPPPPLSSDSAALDQVLVPLIVSRTISATQQKPDNDDYPPPPRHLQRFGWRAQAVTSRQIEDSKVETPTVDLTVELNREQRGQVTAVRYPTTREIETVPSPVDDHKEVSLISRISHHDQPPPHRSLLRIISAKSSSLQSRHRGMPPTTVYRAVDIPFDESSAVYQPKKDENVTIVKVVMGAHPVEKGFGFSIAINRGRPTIETVIVGTPADRAGLLIGDRVIAINGQHLKDKHLSAINRLLHDAARLGEAEVCIEKRNAKIAHVKSVSSLENFDKARSVFVEKSMDSYAEFKRNHRAPRSNQQFVPEFSSLPRSISTGSLPTTKRENSALGAQLFKTPQCYENTSNVRSENKTYSSNKVTPDYRVMSMHEKADPGRLTDFVPESERNVVRTTAEEKTDEEPRLIRYYDLPPTTPSPKHASSANVKHTSLTSSRHLEDQAVNAIPKRSTLPRNLHGETRTQHDDELLSEKSYLYESHRQIYSPSPPLETLRRSSEISDPSAVRTTTECWRCASRPHQRISNSRELRDDATRRDHLSGYRDRGTLVREEWKFDEIYYRRNYGPGDRPRSDYRNTRTTVVPSKHLDTDNYRSTSVSRPYHKARSKSSDMIFEREYSFRYGDGPISDVTHRFYDHDGYYTNREVRRGYDLDIRRDYSFVRDVDRQSLRDSCVPSRVRKSEGRPIEERREYEEVERRMWIPEKRSVESRDWRDIISQQRQAAPGRPRDTQRIRDASSSLGNLPAIINRKLEETRKLEKEQTQMTEYGFCPTVENGYRDIDNYERSSNRGPFEKSYSSEYHNRQYDSLRYDHHETRGDALAADASLKSEYCRRELSPSADYSKRETNAASREDARRESINNNGQVVAVSGKHRCAHCTDELGRGAAMIIESLNLFYHLACFKCYVCKAKLGSGATGADVRVREGRLHCQSCYSNDRMQLSKV